MQNKPSQQQPQASQRRRRLLRMAAAAATGIGIGLAAALPAQAAEPPAFPSKLVRIIVPNPAGGASDVLARLLGKHLAEKWGRPVVVENRAGANGNIGANLVAKAAPDGHTLLLMDLSSLTIAPSLYPDLLYDPLGDLRSVSVAAYSPHILVVRKDLPVNTVQELADYAKAHPEQVNFGQTPGSATHLAGVLLAQEMGFTLNYIGYKGGSQVLSDLAGGQIDAAMNSFLATYPLVQSGNIKLLAVASAGRFGPIPDTPAIAETVPGFAVGSWQGVLAPAGTPDAIIAQIHADIVEVTSRPDMRERFRELGSEASDKAPAELDVWMREESARWGKVVRDNDVRLM